MAQLSTRFLWEDYVAGWDPVARSLRDRFHSLSYIVVLFFFCDTEERIPSLKRLLFDRKVTKTFHVTELKDSTDQ